MKEGGGLLELNWHSVCRLWYAVDRTALGSVCQRVKPLCAAGWMKLFRVPRCWRPVMMTETGWHRGAERGCSPPVFSFYTHPFMFLWSSRAASNSLSPSLFVSEAAMETNCGCCEISNVCFSLLPALTDVVILKNLFHAVSVRIVLILRLIQIKVICN